MMIISIRAKSICFWLDFARIGLVIVKGLCGSIAQTSQVTNSEVGSFAFEFVF